jgi:hypothetical protein
MSQEKRLEVFLKKNINPSVPILESQKRIYSDLISKIQNKTENQRKTLKKIILPKIALYKAFIENKYSKELSYNYVEKYLFENGKKIHKILRIIELMPFFKKIFIAGVRKQMMTNDNWKTEIKTNESNKIEYDIIKCLWYDACLENNCIELCKCFCDVDNIIYKDMRKIIFERTGTLYYGNKCCDFRYKIRS